MSILPNCVKNIRVQALSDSVKLSRRMKHTILDFWVVIFKTTSIRSELPSIANERQVYVNNCDLRIDRDMCTVVIISPKTLIFENFGGGGGVRPVRLTLNPRLERVDIITECDIIDCIYSISGKKLSNLDWECLRF